MTTSKSFKQIVCAHIYAYTYINLYKQHNVSIQLKWNEHLKWRIQWFYYKSNAKTSQSVHKHIAMWNDTKEEPKSKCCFTLWGKNVDRFVLSP